MVAQDDGVVRSSEPNALCSDKCTRHFWAASTAFHCNCRRLEGGLAIGTFSSCPTWHKKKAVQRKEYAMSEFQKGGLEVKDEFGTEGQAKWGAPQSVRVEV